MLGSTIAVDLPNGPQNQQALRRLRLRWFLTAAIYIGGLAGGYWLLTWSWAYNRALWWLVWATLAMVIELVLLWRILPHNHPPASGRLLPTFGYGTALTLACGFLVFLLAGFLFTARPMGWLGWVPALLYTLARLIDYIDGYVARITDHETKLGGILDIEFDGLGVLIAILLGIQYGTLPIWYLPLALSRQLFIAGIWARRKQGLPVYEMTPSANRRIIAGYQTAFISIALWPIFGQPVAMLASILFALPLFFSFLRDWLVVSGRSDPASARYIRTRRLRKQVIEGWLPLAARVGGGFIALTLLVREMPDFPSWQQALQSFDGDPRWLWALALLAAAALGPYFLGCLGRVAALPLLGIAWLDITVHGLQWHLYWGLQGELTGQGNAWLFIAGFIVTHAGSGKWALWQPEEAILRTRPGTSRGQTPQTQ